MRKGTFIATVALLIAIAGAIVAFAAYFKRRSCALCDDLDDEFGDSDLYDMDYYATQVDDARRTATNRTLAILLMFLPTTIFPTRNKLCS